VLETLAYLKQETNVWFEITTLLIPGENDSPAEIEALSCWVMERLGPEFRSTSRPSIPIGRCSIKPATPASTLCLARHIARDAGLRYVFTGNTHDEEGQSTYCHLCEARLIGRDWYDLTGWNLTADGRCTACGTPCAGVFEGPPGTWGRRRRPIGVRAGAVET
jgi:pyruvate formate lyase activating enzyme